MRLGGIAALLGSFPLGGMAIFVLAFPVPCNLFPIIASVSADLNLQRHGRPGRDGRRHPRIDLIKDRRNQASALTTPPMAPYHPG